MTQDIFTIQYPPVPAGTERTDILFYGPTDCDNLLSLLAPSDGQPRILVTDSTVISLPAMHSVAKGFCVPAASPRQADQEPASQDLAACIPGGTTYRKGADTLLVLEPGEGHKTIENVLAIVRTSLDCGLQRSSTFVGIGGGVICDMTAFAASIFKRGARLELVPTTLLAMVDAAVGGKTGCDFDSYKNMIGTFYPASRIHILGDFLQSLPESEYRSGLAETLKTALLYAPKLFSILQNQREQVMGRDPELVRQIIRRCVIAKASIVEKDLTETGLRMQLNLGHTFGHAIEKCADFTVPHGFGVGIGMAIAAAANNKKDVCLKIIRANTNCGLPCCTAFDAKTLAAAALTDKKRSGSTVEVILPDQIGKCRAEKIPVANLETMFDNGLAMIKELTEP